MRLYISPTERYGGKLVMESSFTETEHYGADFALVHGEGEGARRLAIQRKLFPTDLAASIKDGRLADQVHKMAQAEAGLFIFQGLPAYTREGEVVGSNGGGGWVIDAERGAPKSLGGRRGGELTKSVVEQVQMSLGMAGYPVFWVADNKELDHLINSLAKWWEKEEHSLLTLTPRKGTLERRPGGKITARDRQAQALQVVPGVGSKAAKAIAKEHKLYLFASIGQLQEVQGVGPKMAKNIWAVFGDKDA